jgi:benzoyl-CoA reductase/2-hydroxyglutaryl-CoA dehydratase subunit BcrC/BadD/HgdB
MTFASRGKDSERLESTAVATSYQRDFVRALRERVTERGEPFAIAQADTAHEIFHVMGIPVISNQWWSAYIAAKQLSGRYLSVLEDKGFPATSCRYCSLGLACTLDGDPSRAPWGGLPRPVVITARLTCDCVQRVFLQWAEALNTRFYAFEAPGWTHKDPGWFERSRTEWREVYEPARIELHVEEMKGLIRWLEAETGRTFDDGRLQALMRRIDEQEELMFEAARLVGSARPCPVSIAEQMANVMIPQWHRGSTWALEHARRFRDEVRERVEQGVCASERERIRLMWIGAGLWHDPGLYEALQERHGAVFVWSMYLPFTGPQYLRDDGGEPLRALASRVCSMNEVLHLPPWMNAWMVSEAERCAIDAAVILVPRYGLQSASGTKFTKLALESAGVPTVELDADMVDARRWDRARAVDALSEFLQSRVAAARRHGRG